MTAELLIAAQTSVLSMCPADDGSDHLNAWVHQDERSRGNAGLDL